MNVQQRNDVSIYCLSSGPTVPEWLGERARRNLSKRDENIRRRIELLQDFQMPSSSSKIVQSADGRYIVAAGTYPPRIRCFDVHELSVKFERYVNSHVVDVVMLGEDYGKMALLQEDRTIAFHAPYGAHESIRIPTFGRAMAYEPTTCELLVAAKGDRVYRINLEEGRFSEPWTFESSMEGPSSTCIAVAPLNPLAAVGCDDGLVRFWDSRASDTLTKPFLTLDVARACAGRGFAEDNTWMNGVHSREITSIAHDPNGLYMACGTAGGLVALYDIRSSNPLHIKEHQNGTAIHTVKFHPGSGTVLSSDEKLVKVWRYKASRDLTQSLGGGDTSVMDSKDDQKLGSVVVNVEGTGKFTSFIMAGDDKDSWGYKSGLLLCATDHPKMESYYIPKLGLAPRWCSFLENITEELEETDLTRDGAATTGYDKEAIYDNYKFVSRKEVDELGVSNLVGTPLLRGYMHGFFMDINLYNRVKAVANPFEYEEYRKKKVKERLEAKRSSRIAPKKDSAALKGKSTAVNAELADRLSERADSTTKAGKVASSLLADERFGSLFTDPEFAIDEQDENFKLRNPSGVAVSKRKKNDLDSDDDDDGPDEGSVDQDAGPVENTRANNEGVESDVDVDSDSESASDSDEDGFRGGKIRPDDDDDDGGMQRRKRKKKEAKTKKKPKKRTVLEVDNFTAVDHVNDDKRASISEKDLPLAKRLAMQKEALDNNLHVRSGFGSKEVTYVPKDTRKHKDGRGQSGGERADGRGKKGRSRRGVAELRSKRPKF